MRGKARLEKCTASVVRITPAYAGKRIPIVFTSLSLKDHPRLCGEKEQVHALVNNRLGSPPPMRGKGFKIRFVNGKFRITPAYAGKSPSICTILFFTKDHPRLCGEKSFFFSSNSINLGSPPPMRGKVVVVAARISAGRITPAYAGKSP